MTNEISHYQEEIASYKEQIELVIEQIIFMIFQSVRLICFFFKYKTEIKKQTGIKADTSKHIEKLNADINRIQTNYTALEKTDVEIVF